MTPEQDVLAEFLTQIEATRAGLADAEALIGPLPQDVAGFEAMTPLEKVASTALLKGFEQLQDGLARVFRTVLRALGVNLKGLYPLDIANRMAELDVLDDPPRWLEIVKLRNELVHEYPADAETRLHRLRTAHAALPFLSAAADRIGAVVQTKGLTP